MAVTWKNGNLVMTAQGDAVSGRPAVNYGVNGDGSWTVNPATQVVNLQQRVTTINIHPSAASWVVVLTDQGGSVVWSTDGSTATSYDFYGDLYFNGIVLQTATNITRVSMSVESIQW